LTFKITDHSHEKNPYDLEEQRQATGMHVKIQNITVVDKPAFEGLVLKTMTSDKVNHYYYWYLLNRLECNAELSMVRQKMFIIRA
jgi:hypothetical protein